jgi:hypothetical protein
MADEDPNEETEETPPEAEGEERETEEEEGSKNPDLLKAIKARDRAKAQLRELRAEIEKANRKDDAPDPVAEANSRVVRAEARSVLASAGVTDRDDQATILEVINLSDIDVDKRGDVDTEAIESRITELRRILGGSAPPRTRVPRTDTRDRGTKETTTDPDTQRYRDILRGRR